jgi:hypothetical protein
MSGRAGTLHDATGLVLSRAGDLAAGGPWRLRTVSIRTANLLGAPERSGALLDGFDGAVARLLPPEPDAPPSEQAPATGAAAPPAELLVDAVSDEGDLWVEVDTVDGPEVVFRVETGVARTCGSVDVRPPLSIVGEEARHGRVVSRNGERLTRTALLLSVPPAAIEPWMMTAYLNRGGGGNPVVRAFADAIGCRLAYAEDAALPCPGVPVVWGVLRGSKTVLDDAARRGQYFFYIDHAYFARGHGRNYRITRNGFEAGPVRLCPHDRIAALEVEVRPWRRGGREIVCCPPTDFFMEAHGCTGWLERTLATLREVTDRPVVVRTKPKEGERAVALPQALKTAHALVTHSSNVAIEAAVLGTPVFVAPTSAAAPVGRTDLSRIEEPVYPDRAPWLAHLAYNQFSFAEIANGAAWRMLMELEERPQIA